MVEACIINPSAQTYINKPSNDAILPGNSVVVCFLDSSDSRDVMLEQIVLGQI